VIRVIESPSIVIVHSKDKNVKESIMLDPPHEMLSILMNPMEKPKPFEGLGLLIFLFCKTRGLKR
jgi:hypothetical protein